MDQSNPFARLSAPGAAPAQEITPRESPASWRGIPPHRLARVLTCVESRLAERLHVAELAREASMSPFHFARMFKLATGHSPHQYIVLRRMEHAKQLLGATTLPIVQVARRVGFRTQAHFTGVFSRYAGTTPKAYRLSHPGYATRESDPSR
jgi:AraC family transcriptional regulator